ncbi:6-phosphofructokinase [Schaalia sp. ZJ405]|uniref:ADP-dependent glucokinase/phosphofructokinase n=1 Tax=Schaalia sp. ZJ405 TaxID=2709403 RepID=UPI0013EA3838|nr:ADP-dependent glucokinase/phosphofructokinase [Schaalia sp. ZJ405]QPK81330.1 6-phosphofructokinase [Schaalia sp. ZJ405]
MHRERIVLGLGGTVDHEVIWDLAKVQWLADHMGITMDEIEDDPSSVAADARSAFIYLLQMMYRNRGGECHVHSIDSLKQLASHFDSRTTLGGTCVRAAIAMNRIGIGSTVHLVSINDDVRRLLPTGIIRICSADHDSLEPHIIFQFPADNNVRVIGGVVRTSRPNRVIFVHDLPNELMRLSPDLGPALARADAVMISGFNTMKSPDLLQERLDCLREMLENTNDETPIVYEDAGFHDEAMRDIVVDKICNLVDIHSLNEDEATAYVQRSFDPQDGAEIACVMEELRTRLMASNVLLHTSHYAAVLGERAERFAKAAATGCLMASTRYAHGDTMTREDFEKMRTAPRDTIGMRLIDDPDIVRSGIHIVPSYNAHVLSPTTIGLGDSFIGGLMAALGASEEVQAAPGVE